MDKTRRASALALVLCSSGAQANMGNMDVSALLLFLYSPIIGLLLLPPLVFMAMRGRIAKRKWFAILLATFSVSAALAWLASRHLFDNAHGMWVMLPWFLMPLPGWFVALLYERAVRRSRSDQKS